MAQMPSETDLKVIRVTDKLSETVHLMLNDPSMGLYRIQEHVKRSVPNLVEKKIELQSLQSKIQGASYDLDYSLKLESVQTSATSYQVPQPQAGLPDVTHEQEPIEVGEEIQRYAT